MKNCRRFLVALLMVVFLPVWLLAGEYMCKNTGRYGHCIGKGGSILITSDGGLRWQVQSMGNPPLTSVEFVSDSVGCVTGLNNLILVTTDKGKTWDHVSGNAVRNYYDVTWFGKSVAVVAGGRSTQTDTGQVTETVIARTTDLGKTWTQAEISNHALIYSVASGSPLRGVAVGDSGTILLTTDGGITWEQRVSGTHNTLEGVDYLDSIIYVAVGTNGTILRSTDAGMTWREEMSTATHNLHHLAFSVDGYGVAVGDQGTILQSLAHAEHWTKIPSGTQVNLYAVDFANDCTALAVGASGTILRSLDSGSFWAALERAVTEDQARISFAIK